MYGDESSTNQLLDILTKITERVERLEKMMQTPIITHPQVQTMGMKPADFREVSPDEHYETFRALLDEPLALRDYEPDEVDEFWKVTAYKRVWNNMLVAANDPEDPFVIMYLTKFLNFIYHRSVQDWLEDIREGEVLEDTRTDAEKRYDEMYTKKESIIPPEEEEEYYGEGDA